MVTLFVQGKVARISHRIPNSTPRFSLLMVCASDRQCSRTYKLRFISVTQHFCPQKLRRIVYLRKYFFLRVQAAKRALVGIRINGSEFRMIIVRFAVIMTTVVGKR
jgi:hypothetical protein